MEYNVYVFPAVPPKPKSSETEQFGFTIGQPGKVIVMFNANPKPNIHWEVGSESLTEGMRDSTRSFEAMVLQNKVREFHED